jgi:hypothetical protein
MRGVCTSPLGVPFASREQLASTGRLQRCGGRSTAPVVPRAHASMQGAAAAQGPVAPVRRVLVPCRSRGLRACACGVRLSTSRGHARPCLTPPVALAQSKCPFASLADFIIKEDAARPPRLTPLGKALFAQPKPQTGSAVLWLHHGSPGQDTPGKLVTGLRRLTHAEEFLQARFGELPSRQGVAGARLTPGFLRRAAAPRAAVTAPTSLA